MNKEVRFLGLKIFYEKYSNNIYKKRFLVYKKFFDINTYHVKYLLFGYMFMTSTFYGGYSDFILLNRFRFRRSRDFTLKFLYPILKAYLKEKFGDKGSDFICLYNRQGETFLLCHYLDEFMKNNNVKKPIFISIFPYLESITKLFYPKSKFYLIHPVFFELYFTPLDMYNNKNDIRIFCILVNSHFVNLEKELQKGYKRNFNFAIKEKMGIKSNNLSCPVYPKDVIKSSERKMKLLGLKQPFAYISPNAQSNGTMTKEFWDKLPLELHELGYDMFFNDIPWNVPNSSYKHCYLSVAEAKYIAEQADVIIGVRSGLMDVIANKKSKIFCIYHDFFDRGEEFPRLDAGKVLNAFSLKYLPNTINENIFEYNGYKMAEKNILKSIIYNLKQ